MYLFYKEHQTYDPAPEEDSSNNLLRAFLTFLQPDLDIDSLPYGEVLKMVNEAKGVGYVKLKSTPT